MWVGHIVVQYVLCVVPTHYIHAFKLISHQSYVHHTMLHPCIWCGLLGTPYTHGTIYTCPVRIHRMHLMRMSICLPPYACAYLSYHGFPYMSMLICPQWPVTMPYYHLGSIVATSLGFPHHTHLLNLLSPTFVSFCCLQKKGEAHVCFGGEFLPCGPYLYKFYVLKARIVRRRPHHHCHHLVFCRIQMTGLKFRMGY